MSDLGSWVTEIEKEARRFCILFVQLGTAFEPLRVDLNDARAETVSVAKFLESELAHEPRFWILTDLESIRSNRHNALGRLREKIMVAVDAGHVFLMISSVARGAYQSVPGSDIVSDARHIFPPLRPTIDQSPLSALPGWRADDQNDGVFLSRCLSELSSRTVLRLSELLWEGEQSPETCLSALDYAQVEELRGGGLVHVIDLKPVWTISGVWKSFRHAVATSSSSYAQADEWLGETFKNLWLIERSMRNSIRHALIEKLGNTWRDNCLPNGLRSDVLERARKDAQPAAERIAHLRDPLEWLTTSELLDMRENRELGGLGLDPFLWTRFRSVVVPIRNRAAHMRLLPEQDAQTVETWRRLVQRKLKHHIENFGSEPPEN